MAAMADLQEKRRLTLKLIEEVRAQIRPIEENTRKETDDMERRRAVTRSRSMRSIRQSAKRSSDWSRLGSRKNS